MMGGFLIAAAILMWWAGRKIFIPMLRWPPGPATAALSLLSGGMVSAMLGLNLDTWVQANWAQTTGLICVQLGVVAILTSLSWLIYLFIRYPMDPVNAGRATWHQDVTRGIAFDALAIAASVSYAIFSVLFWAGSDALAVGVGFAAFVLALCIAWPVLYRLLRAQIPHE